MANNDWYYEPPDDRAWDAFVDYCDAEDLDPSEEDYVAWIEEQQDRAEDAAIERAEAAREDAMFDERDDW
jgi:hypothetical protein